MSATVIAIVNQKGGVGKTTTAVNLSTILAVMYKKVLMIDVDSQGNASSGVGILQKDRINSIYDIFTGDISIEQSIKFGGVPGLDVIPSNIHLSAIESVIGQRVGSEYILKKQLDLIKEKYDYIIIDCPPALNLLTANALAACDEVIIPMLCDFFSLEGLSHLLKTIDIVKRKLNSNIKIGGVLFTMYDKRNKLTELVEKDVREYLGNLVFRAKIPRNIKLSEAPSHGKAGVIYDYKCSGSLAYMELAKEIMEKHMIKEEMNA